MPQDPQQQSAGQSLARDKSIQLPNGDIKVYRAGTPLALIEQEWSQAQPQQQQLPQISEPLTSASQAPTQQRDLSEVSAGELGGLGLDVVRLLGGLLPGPAGKQGAATTLTKIARKIPALTRAAPRLVVPTAAAGLKAQLEGEDVISGMAGELALGSLGEFGPTGVRLAADQLMPMMGLAKGWSTAGRAAKDASARQMSKTGAFQTRPMLGNKAGLERRKKTGIEIVSRIVDEAEAAGKGRFPGRELRGMADEQMARSARTTKPMKDVDIPVTQLEEEFVTNQLAKRLSPATEAPADALKRWQRLTPDERSNIFDELTFGPRAGQDISTDKLARGAAANKARIKGAPPPSMAEEVGETFDASLAEKAREATGSRVTGLPESRRNLSDILTMKDFADTMLTGPRSMAIRGGALATPTMLANAFLGTDINPMLMAGIGGITDPMVIGALSEVLARGLRGSPTLKRAYDVNETASGLKRRKD